MLLLKGWGGLDGEGMFHHCILARFRFYKKVSYQNIENDVGTAPGVSPGGWRHTVVVLIFHQCLYVRSILIVTLVIASQILTMATCIEDSSSGEEYEARVCIRTSIVSASR